MDAENTLFEIIVGTYEKVLSGYYLELHSDEFSVKQSFITEPHRQSVPCLASNEKFLASGSKDDSIVLFSLKSRREIGSLHHHTGAITSLEFYDSFLVSSSEDNTICIWSTGNWQCLKTLRGHKNAVNCVSIHPSGKMALSVSKDKTLRTWNLIKGRSAYVTNIKKDAEIVKWSPDGSFFVIIHNSNIDVYSIENASVLSTINFHGKICDLEFVNDTVCAVCGEKDSVSFYDITTGSLHHEFKAHKSRIRAVKCIKINEEVFLTTASNGEIKVWHMDLSDAQFKARRVVKLKTGLEKITCMTLHACNK